MDCRSDEDARKIAELIFRLGRSMHDYVAGLSPAQWSVLRYLARANRHSRTVSAFAEFHATTRGTASQTVKSLVEHGYVSKTRSPSDGRSVILDLTDAGSTILSRDPSTALVDAAARLPRSVRRQTEHGLRRVLVNLERNERVHGFGSCTECAFFEAQSHADDRKAMRTDSGFSCSRRDEPVEAAELEQVCMDFRATRSLAKQ